MDDKVDGNDSDKELVGDKNAIVSSISWFCNNEEMSDIVLILGTQRFHAHKFILVLMSDVFRTMCSKRWDKNNVNEIELNECKECVPVFPLFMHFLYHGTVHISTSTALPLLMLADKYNVIPLKMSCEKYIRAQVEKGNVAGAIRWLPYLQLCGHKDLEKDCVNVIIAQMELVLTQNECLFLSIELLMLLLERDDLVVLCEYNLYEGVVKWIESRETQEMRKQYLELLLPLLRFSMMFPEQLLAIESSDFYQEHSDAISPHLARAHRFRSLITEVVDNTFTESSYRPRNYTHSLWCQFVNLDADHTSFFGKTINLSTTNDLLNSSLRSQEPNWQIKLINGKQESVGSVSSLDGMPWRFSGPSSIAAVSSAPSNTIPLQMKLRPLRTVRQNLSVDVSMFMVKKDTLYKHLDTVTITSKELEPGNMASLTPRAMFLMCFGESGSPTTLWNNASIMPTNVFYATEKPLTQPPTISNFARMSQPQMASIFQPSPIHFNFKQPPQPSVESDTILRHRFARDDFEHPAEVPCVSFGPHFASPPRPNRAVRVALIMKPRIRTAEEVKSDRFTAGGSARAECFDAERKDASSADVDELPYLG